MLIIKVISSLQWIRSAFYCLSSPPLWVCVCGTPSTEVCVCVWIRNNPPGNCCWRTCLWRRCVCVCACVYCVCVKRRRREEERNSVWVLFSHHTHTHAYTHIHTHTHKQTHTRTHTHAYNTHTYTKQTTQQQQIKTKNKTTKGSTVRRIGTTTTPYGFRCTNLVINGIN